MPKAEPKIISNSIYLQTLGLLALGHRHSMKAREFEAGLKDLLNMSDEFAGGFGHLTDAMYSSDQTPDFEEAISRAGITIEPKA